jgi:hypothetical protein
VGLPPSASSPCLPCIDVTLNGGAEGANLLLRTGMVLEQLVLLIDGLEDMRLQRVHIAQILSDGLRFLRCLCGDGSSCPFYGTLCFCLALLAGPTFLVQQSQDKEGGRPLTDEQRILLAMGARVATRGQPPAEWRHCNRATSRTTSQARGGIPSPTCGPCTRIGCCFPLDPATAPRAQCGRTASNRTR